MTCVIYIYIYIYIYAIDSFQNIFQRNRLFDPKDFQHPRKEKGFFCSQEWERFVRRGALVCQLEVQRLVHYYKGKIKEDIPKVQEK